MKITITIENPTLESEHQFYKQIQRQVDFFENNIGQESDFKFDFTLLNVKYKNAYITNINVASLDVGDNVVGPDIVTIEYNSIEISED